MYFFKNKNLNLVALIKWARLIFIKKIIGLHMGICPWSLIIYYKLKNNFLLQNIYL